MSIRKNCSLVQIFQRISICFFLIKRRKMTSKYQKNVVLGQKKNICLQTVVQLKYKEAENGQVPLKYP